MKLASIAEVQPILWKVRQWNLSGTVLTRYYREIFIDFVAERPCMDDTNDMYALFLHVFRSWILPLRLFNHKM